MYFVCLMEQMDDGKTYKMSDIAYAYSSETRIGSVMKQAHGISEKPSDK